MENLHLLLKISPPQIQYKIIDASKGLIEQEFYIKTLKKQIRFQVIHEKTSKNSFLIKIISGPLKGTETEIVVLENGDKSIIEAKIKLKMSLSYKIFSSILSKKIQSVNMTLFNRLEKFAELLYNKKYQISFEKNFEVLIIYLENKKLFFEGWWLGDISILFGNAYQKLPLKNKTVIDVGTNIGDSAIHFIHHGAKRVIGLEPFPINYTFFKLNVKRNNLAEKIEIIQGGCSSKSSSIYVNPNLSGLSYKMENTNGGQKINQFSIEELIKKYNIIDGVIKMNCEGCEYDVIINTPNEILNFFSHMIIQYHGGHQTLMKKLEDSGFIVTFESYSEFKGQIFAEKKMD
jgi:FkbM family methyltransferase